MADKLFLTDIKTLRERARRHIEKGAVTEGFAIDDAATPPNHDDCARRLFALDCGRSKPARDHGT